MRTPHLLLVISLILSACGTTAPNHNINENTKPLTFVDQLRQGGHVIFIRHASTDQTQQDIDSTNLSDCTQQRNLDELGRLQSQKIGTAFRQLDIPVGDVKTSFYCRCIDTAKLAFDKSIATMEITSIQNAAPEAREQRITTLREMISTKPTEGKNLIIVGHKSMFKEVSGQLLEEGEAAIYQPQDDGSTILVKRIRPENWGNIMQPTNKTASAN